MKLEDWWRRLGRAQRVVAVAVIAVVSLNVGLLTLQSTVGGGQPGGPVSSSFSTGSSGLEGYADLLSEAGHPVTRLREVPTGRALATGSTVVVADPASLGQREGRAIATFLASGGRLIVAGRSGAPLVQAVTGGDITWSDHDPVRSLQVWVPADGVGSAHQLAGDEGGRWSGVGGLLPVAGTSEGAAIVVGEVGQGRLIAVADGSLLQNEHLAQADNAAFGLGAAGARRRPVLFVESVHGFGQTGLRALPSSWKWAALATAVALVAALWSAGTRFGPAEPEVRVLAPPRLEHVLAVAADLDRVSPPPSDLAAALAEGARLAALERRQRGLTDTVPADHHRTGAPQ